MRTAEDSSGTVLHRLIQEQLRYGNPTDTPTLLAIQQQALRGGSCGGGVASPLSSLESLGQEESQTLQMSARQEPQGQEHQGDLLHMETSLQHLYRHREEELPSYEEAKAHSQYLASQRGWAEPPIVTGEKFRPESTGLRSLKHEHVRSLSERLLQLSLERNRSQSGVALSPSHSYPQLSKERTQDAVLYALCQQSPPPQYPFLVRSPGYMLSHSQEQEHFHKEPPALFLSPHHKVSVTPSQGTWQKDESAQTAAGLEDFEAARCQVEALKKENERLRRELQGNGEKVSRLQKMEKEIWKISEAYEVLMKGSVKREGLEKMMRNKLEAEMNKLHDLNRALRDRLETANKQLAAKEAESVDQKQHMFVSLLQQNKEHDCERLEQEVQKLRGASQEQQRQVVVLERALRAAQVRCERLEEELRRKRAYVEKVERTQHALGQLQAACEKREALEQKLRTRLEQELKALRTQQRQTQDQRSSPSLEPNTPVLLQQLREREEHILALEADITKWQQKYLEESTVRQFAMEAAAMAATQRDTTIISHSPQFSPNSSFNEHLLSANVKHHETERRIRALYAELLEKNAVIRVLQQRMRHDVIKADTQGLRSFRSAPSISGTTAGSPLGKTSSVLQGQGQANCLSDEQAVDGSAPSYTPARTPGCESTNQAGAALECPSVTEPTTSLATAHASDVQENLQDQQNGFKVTHHLEAEVIEILI